MECLEEILNTHLFGTPMCVRSRNGSPEESLELQGRFKVADDDWFHFKGFVTLRKKGKRQKWSVVCQVSSKLPVESYNLVHKGKAHNGEAQSHKSPSWEGEPIIAGLRIPAKSPSSVWGES